MCMYLYKLTKKVKELWWNSIRNSHAKPRDKFTRAKETDI